MSAPPNKLSVHLEVWHRVLGDWLSWPEHRITAFVGRWQKFFEPPSDTDAEVAASLVREFYHRWPAERLIRLLFSPSLRRRGNADQLSEIQSELENAIYQGDHSAHCLPSYDWD